MPIIWYYHDLDPIFQNKRTILTSHFHLPRQLEQSIIAIIDGQLALLASYRYQRLSVKLMRNRLSRCEPESLPWPICAPRQLVGSNEKTLRNRKH